MSISIRQHGNFKNTERLFRKATSLSDQHKHLFEKYGREGVRILSENTPSKTGHTANSWYYEITSDAKGPSLSWNNANLTHGVPVVILLHYGHSTNNGGYVKGIDFINPALKPIFNKLSEDLWREVVK